MQKKYPENLYQLYELILEFTEKLENFYDQLQRDSTKMFEKINAILEAASVPVVEADADAMAEQALESDAAPVENEDERIANAQRNVAAPVWLPPDAATENPQLFWDEKQGKWVNEKPVKKGELDF